MAVSKTISIDRLRRRVFRFNGSAADERFFKLAISEWLRNEGEKAGATFTDLLWHITWLRNNKGQTTKYLYFNEHLQRLFLDKDFLEWAKIICQAQNELIKSLTCRT